MMEVSKPKIMDPNFIEALRAEDAKLKAEVQGRVPDAIFSDPNNGSKWEIYNNPEHPKQAVLVERRKGGDTSYNTANVTQDGKGFKATCDVGCEHFEAHYGDKGKPDRATYSDPNTRGTDVLTPEKSNVSEPLATGTPKPVVAGNPLADLVIPGYHQPKPMTPEQIGEANPQLPGLGNFLKTSWNKFKNQNTGDTGIPARPVSDEPPAGWWAAAGPTAPMRPTGLPVPSPEAPAAGGTPLKPIDISDPKNPAHLTPAQLAASLDFENGTLIANGILHDPRDPVNSGVPAAGNVTAYRGAGTPRIG